MFTVFLSIACLIFFVFDAVADRNNKELRLAHIMGAVMAFNWMVSSIVIYGLNIHSLSIHCMLKQL